MEERGAARRPVADYRGKQESADYSSKQNNRKSSCLSHHPSLSLPGDMGMEEHDSLLAMYVSGEKQTFDHDWYWGRNRQKKPTRGECSN